MVKESKKFCDALSGDKLYQVRARETLPLLIRQAKVEQTIFYSDLANELDMPNPRNLNYVLGFIGEALVELCDKWEISVPPIQCIVINKTTNLPGEGFYDIFPEVRKYKNYSNKEKKDIIKQYLRDVFYFNQWDRVLNEFGLAPFQKNFNIKNSKVFGYGGGGESNAHKKFKEFISTNPQLIGLPNRISPGKIEFKLPSTDAVDILFVNGSELIGVEVKASNSDRNDIIRGIYQCIKYKALIEAMQIVEQKKPNAKTILVLENKLPIDLISLKNILGIEIIDSIIISKHRVE